MYKNLPVTKKFAIQFFSCLTILLCLIHIHPSETKAKLSTEPNTSFSFSWDITGDGKKDKIKFIHTENKDYTSTLKVKINGKLALTWSIGIHDYQVHNFFCKKLTLKNGKRFLYIEALGDSDDGYHRVYSYKKGKLKQAMNLDPDHVLRWIDKIEVKGNKVVVDALSSGGQGLGFFSYRIIYSYKNGKFVLDSKTHKILGYTEYPNMKRRTLTANQPITLYTKKDLKKKKTVLPKGGKVKATKIYISKNKVAIYVTGKKYKGWYNADKFEAHGGEEAFIGTTVVA